jgi:thiamine biosynthesis protein ThiS
MKVTVNGEERDTSEGVAIAGLLEQLGMKPDRVAVELNREIIPRSRWAEIRLHEGDRLEIVHFVGGGRVR